MLRNCSRCGKLFAAAQSGICLECSEREEADFDRVRAYLRDHPSAGVAEVAEGAGVSERQVLHFLRTGRLRLSGGNGILTCRVCGTSIEVGQVCPQCAARLRGQLAAPRQQASRMYMVDRVQQWHRPAKY